MLAKKAVVDYLVEHVDYNADFRAGQVGFEFGLPAKKISNNLADFEEEFNRSVSAFKREGILTLSDYDPKKRQFDSESIIKKYAEKTHNENETKYNKLFNPIERLRVNWCADPYLNQDADFYRIISADELINLAQTKKTGTLIDSNGHFTSGHYSCITTNPNYNEQAFRANGLPIKLKFKTKDDNGLYNMDLLNRINGLKEECSIYRVFGYNYYDIDWDNVYVNMGDGWEQLDRSYFDNLLSKCLS